jgi:hypothetical protein
MNLLKRMLFYLSFSLSLTSYGQKDRILTIKDIFLVIDSDTLRADTKIRQYLPQNRTVKILVFKNDSFKVFNLYKLRIRGNHYVLKQGHEIYLHDKKLKDPQKGEGETKNWKHGKKWYSYERVRFERNHSETINEGSVGRLNPVGKQYSLFFGSKIHMVIKK